MLVVAISCSSSVGAGFVMGRSRGVHSTQDDDTAWFGHRYVTRAIFFPAVFLLVTGEIFGRIGVLRQCDGEDVELVFI